MSKTVYNIDPITRIYLGPQQCYKSSLDDETWLFTGSVMETEPPSVNEHEVAVATEDLTAWEIKPFYVGQKYWLPDGSAHEITEPFIAPPADALFEAPILPLTDDQLIAKFKSDIQKRLDDFAKTRGYDGCLSCCTYADSAVIKFATEGNYMKQVRDQHWAIGYEIISDVQAGNREVSTLEQLFIEIGPLEWPN